MKNTAGKRKFWKIFGIVVAVLLVCLIAVGIGLPIYGQRQMNKVKNFTFREALQYTTKGKKDAAVTVGIIKDGNASYTVYGEAGKELPKEIRSYEIGAVTKTFTGALIQKAVADGKVSLEATIDTYLELPEGNVYPTVKDVLTNTAGYDAWYFESSMTGNFVGSKNEFSGITKNRILEKAGQLNMDKGPYGYVDSNFGYALLGMIAEAVYGRDYEDLVNDFTTRELQMKHTMLLDDKAELANRWQWKRGDAYLAAGGMTSRIDDMLAYAQMQLEGKGLFEACQKSLREVNGASARYHVQDIYIDEMATSWAIDNNHGFIWSSGATGNYNCYLGFNPKNQTAVVILSNLPPDERAPAAVLGIKALKELQ